MRIRESIEEYKVPICPLHCSPEAGLDLRGLVGLLIVAVLSNHQIRDSWPRWQRVWHCWGNDTQFGLLANIWFGLWRGCVEGGVYWLYSCGLSGNYWCVVPRAIRTEGGDLISKAQSGHTHPRHNGNAPHRGFFLLASHPTHCKHSRLG